MQETNWKRYLRMLEVLETDPALEKLMKENAKSYNRFVQLTGKLPKFLRNRLWEYPGTLYFLHHRTLLILCRTMRFDDEDPTQ